MLDALAAQTHRDFRVLVFDQSADTRQNSDSVDRLDDPSIAHIIDDRRGKSYALNDAIRASRAPFLAFTDDDCAPAPEWLERSLATLGSDDSIGLLFGNVIAYEHDPNEAFVPAVTFERSVSHHGPLMRSRGVIGMGANMVVRRSALSSTGLFDEDLGPGGRLRTGEDCELTYRMLRHGHVVHCDSELDVVHFGARSNVDGAAAAYIHDSYFDDRCRIRQAPAHRRCSSRDSRAARVHQDRRVRPRVDRTTETAVSRATTHQVLGRGRRRLANRSELATAGCPGATERHRASRRRLGRPERTRRMSRRRADRELGQFAVDLGRSGC